MQQFLHLVPADVVSSPAAFVVVGVAGFAAAVSTPTFSTIFFIDKITTYHQLLPSLLVGSSVDFPTPRRSTFNNHVVWRSVASAPPSDDFVDELQTTMALDLLEGRLQEVIIPARRLPLADCKQHVAA